MSRSEPRILYHHPLLDEGYDAQDDDALMSDDEIDELVARLRRRGAAGAGGRLRLRRHQALPRLPGPRVPERRRPAGQVRRQLREPHPLPARRSWPGSRRGAPGLEIAVRFSAVDFVPFVEGPTDARCRPCSPATATPTPSAATAAGSGIDLGEPLAFLDLLAEPRHHAGGRLGRRRVQLAPHGALSLAAGRRRTSRRKIRSSASPA